MRERDHTPFRYQLVPFSSEAKHSELRRFVAGSDKVVRVGWDMGLLSTFKAGRDGFKELAECYDISNSGIDIV